MAQSDNSVMFSKDKEDVLKELESSKKGLTFSEAKTRLQKNGKNLLVGKKKKNEFVRFLGQFKDILIIVLIVSSIISIIIGAVTRNFDEFLDAGIIMLVVFINAIIGYIQERKSEQAMEALKSMTKPYCKVIREGTTYKIKSEELTIGDIVVLEAGDIVPADLRLLSTSSLKIEESALTGESAAIEKDADVVLDEKTILGDRVNMAFMGSIVTYGRGTGVVVSVGMKTEMGKIASALDEIKEEPTPLTKRIKSTNIILTISVLLVAVVIFIVGIVTNLGSEDKTYILNAFTMAIAVAVCVIPEGLPACMTITLSNGVKRMSEQRAIVKKLPAVETLGSTEVICTDKTGTLTLNKMTVKKAFFFDDALKEFNKFNFTNKNVSANSVKVANEIDEKRINFAKDNKNVREFIRCMVLCNDVQIKLEGDNLTSIGDPTEVALVHCGYFFGASKDKFEGQYPRVGEIPFDSNRKMMTTVNCVEGTNYIYTKGAVDSILERCDRVLDNGKIRKLKLEDKEKIAKSNSELGYDALRVLALAFKKDTQNNKKYSSEETEKNLIFIGLVGMIDPPREEVAESIKTCKEAGITTIMITGDHKDTAFAIAKELGICTDKRKVITGAELDKISDEKFVQLVNNYSIYARVSPEHKVKIVKALKANNKIIAMTGDGVNDAPSIKAADIGVGMGITGTDVTKEAADIILTDDNFATIVGAVKEGRKIYNNILKIIEFLLGTSLAELIVMTIVTCVFQDYTFFTPVLLLWINFVSDTFVGLALGFEQAEKNIMKEKPHKTTGNLFKGKVGFNIIVSAIFVSVISLVLYSVLTYVYHLSSEHVTTICFIYLCFTEIFHSYNLKSDTESLFSSNPFKNKTLNWCFLISLLLTVILVLLPVPAIQSAFGTCSLGWWEWLLAIGLAILIVPYFELVKVFVRYKRKKKGL